MMKDITILISPDYQPNELLDSYINDINDKSKIFGFMVDEINKSDISVVNLEYPITKEGKKIQKFGPSLSSSENSLLPLKAAGYNLATLANNHILNYGQEGVNSTIELCNKHGISTVGAGRNINEARNIFYKDINGRRISILNFAEVEFNIATKTRAGANPLDLIYNLEDIKKAKEKSDFVILIIHSGYDFVYQPVPEMVRLYRFYAEQGVNAIISHHSHYISSNEIHKGVPIYYGLGNFIHYKSGFEQGYYIGSSVKLKIQGNKLLTELIPHYLDIDNKTLLKLNNSQLEQFNSKILELNDSLSDFQILKSRFFNEVLDMEELRYLVLLNGLPNSIFKVFRKLKMQKILYSFLLINRKRYLLNWNVLRCEHHKDIVTAFLNKSFYNEDNCIF